MDGLDRARRRHAGALPLRRDNGWLPDLDDLRSKITPRTKAIVVINPNNPTGAVYPEAGPARRSPASRASTSSIVLADEIYDKILYDDAMHLPFASVAPDVFTLTFNGLSKAYRVAGFRAGWLMVNGPKRHATQLPRGHLTMLANMRLCANVPGAARGADRARRPAEHPRADPARRPAARAARRRDRGAGDDPGRQLRASRRARSTCSRGSTRALPDRRRPAVRRSTCCAASTSSSSQGTGFNWPHPDHLRIVTLPRADDLTEAIGRIGEFLAQYYRGEPLPTLFGTVGALVPARGGHVAAAGQPHAGQPVRPAVAVPRRACSGNSTRSPASGPATAATAALEKEAWVSDTLLEWGSCGQLVYVDGVPAGLRALRARRPTCPARSRSRPRRSPPDAVLLMTARLVPEFRGGGLGRMLVQGVARDSPAAG